MTSTELVFLDAHCLNCSTESVFDKQPIQDKYVAHRQRSSHTNWWPNVEVGVLHYKLTSPVNSIFNSDWNVLSGDKLADWVYDVYRGR